jgi:hypothetical protein
MQVPQNICCGSPGYSQSSKQFSSRPWHVKAKTTSRIWFFNKLEAWLDQNTHYVRKNRLHVAVVIQAKAVIMIRV